MSPTDIVVTARGMVSALGAGARSACAAARAGIVRARELDYFRHNAIDPEGQGVTAHAAALFTRGFEGYARFVRLTQGALADLQSTCAANLSLPPRMAFYLSLPDPARRYSGLDLIEDERARQKRRAEAELAGLPALELEMVEPFLRAAAAASAWPGVPVLRNVVASGHTGVAELVARATADLQRGSIDGAFVGGVDSLLDVPTLEWLEALGRLKSGRNPTGLQPGEAAAFLLLETQAGAAKRNARPIALLKHVGIADETCPFVAGRPSTGAALAETIAACAVDNSDAVWIVSDHNGEEYRAYEWGMALVRLVRHAPRFANPLIWYPVASFGDCGAATGAVALCAVISAFERAYSPRDHGIAVTAADGPRRAAVLFAAPTLT